MFKKKTLEDELKAGKRENRRIQRGFERDQLQLDRDEKQLQAEIKKMAQQGNKEACVVLAKQLVKVRQQKTKSISMGAKLNGISMQQSLMGTNMKMAQSMKSTAKTMEHINKQMDPATTAKIMQEFSKQNMKMSMGEEAMNDVLADIFESDEAEEDAVVQQVLDEIGVEISTKMAGAPSPAAGSIGGQKVPTDDDLEAQLAQLRAL
ncbi:Charged multivesicular body protein 2b [Sparganum proliferum]